MCVCSTIASAPRSPRRPRSRQAGRRRGSRARASSPRLPERAQREVRDGDRRREPVVEAARQAEARVQRVPAERAARARARAACARGTARTCARSRKCARHSRSNSARRYSCTCHGLPERAAPARRERQHVRRRDVDDSVLLGDERARSGRAPRPGPVRCSIVCRNTTASAGSEKVSISSRAKRRFARAVAQARVLVRLGVRVDADDARRRAREHVRAVALAAGHVDHAQAGELRRDPLVDDEVAAKPVVLLGHVRQRALAGQRQRRHAVGLVALLEARLRG